MGLHGLFWTWWLILFATALLASLTGLLLSQCLSSVVAIYISIPMLLIPQILLCGLVVSFSDLTPKIVTSMTLQIPTAEEVTDYIRILFGDEYYFTLNTHFTGFITLNTKSPELVDALRKVYDVRQIYSNSKYHYFIFRRTNE